MRYLFLESDHVRILTQVSEEANTPEAMCRIVLSTSQTYELVEFQISGEGVAGFVSKEAAAALSFLTRSENAAGEKLRYMLETATRTALELDRIFMSSRALLRAGWPEDDHDTGHADLHEDFIKVESWDLLPKIGNKKTRRQISISPFVEKRGNAAGHNYEGCIVLCKAKAVALQRWDS